MAIGDLVDRWDFRDRDLVARRLVVADPRSDFFETLRRDMARHHECLSYGAGNRLETIGVPFAHVVLTGHDSLVAEQDRLRSHLQKTFGGYVDPLIGLRVRYFSPADPWEPRAAFFGRGVFVPDPGEEPIGAVLVRPLRNGVPVGEPVPVRLPPSGKDGPPAGFYRGQTSLAFARSGRHAPAVHGALPEDAVVFHLSPRRGIGRAHDTDLAFFDRPLENQPDAAHRYMREAVRTGDPANPFRELDISVDGKPVFRLSYALDIRDSSLRSASPGPWSLRVVGLVAPSERLLHRWWIDLDSDGRLVSAAALDPARSIVCEGDSVSAYDWNRHRFEDQADWEIQSGPGGVSVLRPKNGHPDLGLIEPPTESCPVAFGGGRSGLFALDWLDFTGAVQRPAAKPVRLARWWATSDDRHRRETIMPGFEGPSGTQRKVLVRRGNGRFAPWDGRWEEGLEFSVGALLLMAVRGGVGL